MASGWLTARSVMHWWRGADHDGDALGASASLDGVGDLRRERLLHLQPAREDVDDACELGQADDAPVRNVGDVRDAGERRDVVLAMALEAHVAQQDHVAIAGDVLEGAGELGRGILAIAAEALLEGLDDALRAYWRGPERAGSSPAQASSVRTASSASCAGGPARRQGSSSLTPGVSFTGRSCRVAGIRVRAARDVRGGQVPYIIGMRRVAWEGPAASMIRATHGRSERDLQLEASGAGGAHPAFAAAARRPTRPSPRIPSCAARPCRSTLTMQGDEVTGYGQTVKACLLGQAACRHRRRAHHRGDARPSCAKPRPPCAAC